jgi:hypothetical protein
VICDRWGLLALRHPTRAIDVHVCGDSLPTCGDFFQSPEYTGHATSSTHRVCWAYTPMSHRTQSLAMPWAPDAVSLEYEPRVRRIRVPLCLIPRSLVPTAEAPPPPMPPEGVYREPGKRAPQCTCLQIPPPTSAEGFSDRYYERVRVAGLNHVHASTCDMALAIGTGIGLSPMQLPHETQATTTIPRCPIQARPHEDSPPEAGLRDTPAVATADSTATGHPTADAAMCQSSTADATPCQSHINPTANAADPGIDTNSANAASEDTTKKHDIIIDDLMKLTLKELRERLKERGLSSNGTKKTLAARLSGAT